MKKIVHVGYGHRYSDVRIVRKECKTLQSNQSYDVMYITSDKNGNYKEDYYNGIRTKVIALKQGRGKRLVAYLRSLRRDLLSLDADIYHIHESILLPLVFFLKEHNKMVIYDMHEDSAKDWGNHFKSYGKVVAKVVEHFVGWYEKKAISKADGFIYVTPQFSKQGINCKNKAMIPNFPQISNMNGRSISYNEYRNRPSSICFAGGISEIWSQYRIIDIISNIDNLIYYLAGYVTEDFLAQIKSLSGWEKVQFYGKISFEEVKCIYNQSKIGMALLTDAAGNDRTGTLGNTKIYEFMQAGLPIICSNFQIWEDIIQKYHCGICVDPTDNDQIKDAILYLLNNPKEAYEMGQAGCKAVECEYNWECCEEKLLEIYSNILNNGKNNKAKKDIIYSDRERHNI